MGLDRALFNSLIKGSTDEAWNVIIRHTLEIAVKPLTAGNAPNEVIKRDREIGALDHFLSSSGWELWKAFGSSVRRTSDRLAQWWTEPYNARAVLVLDGLSLRELPWLLQGAQEHGFTLHEVGANASELPGDTNEFAKSLGFGNRSQLQNNGGGLAHRLLPAHTECVDYPWKDCANLINADPNWIFWHQWPDCKVHDGAGAGQGLDTLTRDAADQLSGNDFWSFVERMATGRRLVITSDHGYAATGYFPDAEGEVGQFLKKTFASGRSLPGAGDAGPYVPPVALQIDSPHGVHLIAMGRWKWKSQGGYPTLAHGGLSLLEVLSPWVEISKAGKNI
jgi:hypothetical protein